MATDDGLILSSREHGLHEAEPAQAPLECIKLFVADPPRVRAGGVQVIVSNCRSRTVTRSTAIRPWLLPEHWPTREAANARVPLALGPRS